MLDYPNALKYNKMACDMDYGIACTDIGYMYGTATGVKFNIPEARKYYKKACNLGDEQGCKNYQAITN